MHKLNRDEVQMKYRHSSKLFRLDAEMLKVFPGEDTGWGRSAASIAAPAKETLNAIVSFFLFRKVKILFRCLWLVVSKNGH